MIKSFLLCLLFCWFLSNSVCGQYIKPQGPRNTKIETGLSKMPNEQELKRMSLAVIKRPEHQEFIKLITANHPVSKPFDQAYKWDLVRTRGWTSKQPYIRSYLMKGNFIAAVLAIPVKVEKKKLVIDNSRSMHGCVPVECPICILQHDVDSNLLGCAVYGVDDAYYKSHPNAHCEHYLRKPYGEVLTQQVDPAVVNRAEKPKKTAKKKRRR